MPTIDEIDVPHVGWLAIEPGDDVALFLRQGWFEAREQAFLHLYLRAGDTVIDCGAHVGLFSVLAGKCVGSAGRVISIEPSPRTLELLQQNRERHHVPGEIIAGALAGSVGQARFHVEPQGRAAYNALTADAADAAIDVATETLDALVDRLNMQLVDFTKLDVEGAELAVIGGAQKAMSSGRLPVIMIEFTEQNLSRSGASTRELFDRVQDSGYTLCSFNSVALTLQPRPYDGPIDYDNLIAVRDLAFVNDRLRTASAETQRIAGDILARAAACELIHTAEATRRERDDLARTVEDQRERVRVAEAAAVSLEGRVNRLELDHRELRERMYFFCTSKWEQLSWNLGVRKRPPWIADFLARYRADFSPPGP